MILEYVAAIAFTVMQGFTFSVVMPIYGILSLFM